MTVRLTIEISSPLTKKDHVILRNATMVMIAIANEEIGLITTPTDDAEEPVEEPVEEPAPPAQGGLN